MAMFNLLKIRTSIDIFKNEKCKVTFGLEHIKKVVCGGLGWFAVVCGGLRWFAVFRRCVEFVVCKCYPVHLLYTQCLIAGEIKTIGGGIRVPWTLFLVSSQIIKFGLLI